MPSSESVDLLFLVVRPQPICLRFPPLDTSPCEFLSSPSPCDLWQRGFHSRGCDNSTAARQHREKGWGAERGSSEGLARQKCLRQLKRVMQQQYGRLHRCSSAILLQLTKTCGKKSCLHRSLLLFWLYSVFKYKNHHRSAPPPLFAFCFLREVMYAYSKALTGCSLHVFN